jgi:hypothetical protein
MTGLEFLIWTLVGGYAIGRWRIFKWQEAKRDRRPW